MKRVTSLGILLLAIMTRLWDLDAPSLWMDEAFSHFVVALPFKAAWRAIIVDAVHPPLYYLLLRPWLFLAGSSEFALRFPSVLAGTLTIALVIRVGGKWIDERSARWAGFLLAVNPFHVWYAQEARMYALLGLLSLATLTTFWHALHRHRTWCWVALACSSAVAYLTHYFALFLPLVQFIYLLSTFRRHHRAFVPWTITQALASLPLAGWLMRLYSTGGGTFGIGWIPRPQLDDLIRTLWAFGLAYDDRVTPAVLLGLSLWVTLWAYGVLGGTRKREVALFLFLAVALPPITTFLLSLRRPTYVDRFFIGSLPGFVLLGAAGLGRLPRGARWAAGLTLVGLSLGGVTRFHTDPIFIREDWREAAAFVETREEKEDVLALRRLHYLIPFNYYYQGRLEPVPASRNRETASLTELAPEDERLWLIYRKRHEDPHHLAWGKPFDLARDETEEQVLEWLEAHTPSLVKDFSGVIVMLFDQEGGS